MTFEFTYGGSWNAPKSMWKMIFPCDGICIIFWNTQKSNNLIFSSFSVLKLITCQVFEMPHFYMFEIFEMPHFSHFQNQIDFVISFSDLKSILVWSNQFFLRCIIFMFHHFFHEISIFWRNQIANTVNVFVESMFNIDFFDLQVWILYNLWLNVSLTSLEWKDIKNKLITFRKI